jgi:Na+/serine symporter
MSRDPVDDDPRTDRQEPPGPAPSGRLRRTGPGTLVVLALVGLVLGWLIRPVATGASTTVPQIAWLQVGALYFIAAVLAIVARATHQTLHLHHRRLQPHQAVNRLVLAKSCALAGAVLVGGYLGYALSFVGIESDLTAARIIRGVVAAGGAALLLLFSLLLERACQVRDDDEET